MRAPVVGEVVAVVDVRLSVAEPKALIDEIELDALINSNLDASEVPAVAGSNKSLT
jgi:hypothetical protein